MTPELAIAWAAFVGAIVVWNHLHHFQGRPVNHLATAAVVAVALWLGVKFIRRTWDKHILPPAPPPRPRGHWLWASRSITRAP